MNKPEITTASFYDKNNSPKGYSIFDNPDNEKRRLLFNENDKRTTGFLKFPSPTFAVMRKSSSYNTFDERDQLIGSESCDEVLQQKDASETAFDAPMSCFQSGLGGDDVQNKDEEQGGSSKDITQDVHKRLQQQLALKQREVQEIQQKIAKNKKWGDPRRGPPQERYNSRNATCKLPMVRSCPDSLNQMSGFSGGQRWRNDSFSRLNDTGSNLDPNSPCFYPSHVTMNINHSIWRPDGLRQQDRGEGPDERFQKGDAFTPFYQPISNSRGQRNTTSSSYNNCNGSSSCTINHFENCETYRGYDKMKKNFGAVGRPVFNQGYLGRRRGTNGNDNEEYWPNSTMYDTEDNGQITSNDLGTCAHPEVDQIKTAEHDKFGSSFNDTTRNFTSTNNQKFKIQRNVCQPTTFNKIEASKDGFSRDAQLANAFSMNPNRLRMVRKRQDGSRAWKQSDPQFKPSNAHLCPSCKFNVKWPRVVSCLHSFCFPCIVKHLDQELNQIKCPICSTVTDLDGKSLRELDIDFTACKNLLQSKRANPFSCMNCSHDKYATKYCQECMKYICADCHRDHEKSSLTSNHTIHKAAKMIERQGNFYEACSEHDDKVLEQYCEDCKQLVCDECTSFGERHSTHALGNMDKLYHSVVGKIRLMNNNMDEVRNEVQKRIQPLTILKQHIESSIRLCKQDIHKYSNSLLAETEKCRAKARLVIDKAHEEFTKDIEVAENLMIQYTSEYMPLIAFFRRYFFSSNSQDFMSLSPTIQKKILCMNEKHAEIQNHESIFDTKISFKANYSGVSEYLQNQYNQIMITENLSDALPSDSTEMGRLIEKDIMTAMQRSSHHFSQPGSLDLEPKLSSGSSSPEDESDPQAEIFNYNRTGINFIHQFGKYGRGEYEFVEPSGVLYLLDGCLAVCDTANHRIMIYDSQFKHLRTIGQPPNLPPLRDQKEAESSRNDKHFSRTESCLYFPYRIAQCPKTENIVVVERPPSRDIQIFTVLGEFINCFGNSILQHPRGVAVDEHGVIVTVEGRTMKLMLFSQEGQLMHRFFLSVHLEFPNDVAARDGLIYISDNRGHCVHVFDYHAEHKRTIGNESVTYYPIGVSLTHLNQAVVTDNHNTFNISVFNAWPDGRYAFGFKSRVRHANCYNVAVHPHRFELAVTSRENQVVVFNFDPLRMADDDNDKRPEQAEIRFRNDA